MITSMKRSLQSSKTWYRSMLAGNPKMEYGAYELISTAYGTGSSGTITFSSIPSTYKHLQIRLTNKNTNNAYDVLYLRFNGDSATNYSYHTLYGSGTSVASSSGSSTTFARLTGGNGTVDGYTASVVDVLDYGNTSKNTTVRVLDGYSGASPRIFIQSGAWRNTAAVTSISITDSDSNFTTASRFSLYGIKG